jgi:hypothetical protein
MPSAVAQRQAAKVLAIELQKVERLQHGLADGAAPVESVEDCNAVWPAHHCLAVERERGSDRSSRSRGA